MLHLLLDSLAVCIPGESLITSARLALNYDPAELD